MSIHIHLRSHPSLSNTRSVNTHNNQHNSQSIQTRIVKLRRQGRHRSHNHQPHRDQSRKETRSNSFSHNTNQPTNNTNEPFDFEKEDSITFSAQRHQNKSNNVSVSPIKTVTYPASSMSIPQCQSLSFSSSQNLQLNENSEERLTTKDIESKTTEHTEEKNGWPDWTSFENGHRQKVNKIKKNKCSHSCRIILIVLTVVFSIVIAIILGVLLSKPKVTTNTVTLRWNSMATTIAGVTGQPGNASNLLFAPFGIALDFNNSLYIADASNNRIQKYSKDESFGITVSGNITSSDLNFPSDLILDSNDNIYVTDTYNYRVQFWASGSSSEITVAGTGISGSTNDSLGIVYGVARDPNSGTIYVSDTGNHRIMSYLSGSSSGTVIAGGNGAGSSMTQLSNPIGLCFDSSTNSLLIANYGTNNIVRWIIGANNWTLVAGNKNGLSGMTSSELNQPMDVTLDPMGNIYVVDMGNDRIQFFSHDQADGITILGVTNSNGNSSTLFNNPYSLTLDNQLNLYVADTYNHRVQKFFRF